MSERKNKIERLYAKFKNPPKEFSPAPFFFMNYNMEPRITEVVLKELVDKGIRGVVLHPRTGLTVKFASSEFWGKLTEIVKIAKKLGMVVWLYDDYNWPSGTAAGKVIQERPEFAASGLVFRYGRTVEKWEELVGAYSIKKENFKLLKDIPKGRKSLLVTTRRMTDSNFAQTAAPWFISSDWGTLDIMNPDATDYFIKLVYRGFEKHLKKYFRNPIVGVFTDEPQHYRPFPWTESFVGHFINRFGYDIVDFLPSLIEDIGDFKKVRRDYYSLVGGLTAKSYHSRLRHWTEKHGLLLTGHLGEEDFPEKFPHTHGSPYSALTELDLPGTDYLGSGHGYMKDESLSGFPNFNPKLASAAARTKEKGRTLCEIWGGSGWGHGPRSLKKSIDWAAALGINLFVPHAVHTSIMGLRKRDFPPSHFIQQPFWKDYKIFADYISRLSLMTSAANRITKILVLFPITSIWIETTGMGTVTKRGKEVIENIKEISEGLLRSQKDFDYIFEEDIETKTAQISPGTIGIGKFNYDTLIVPDASLITGETRNFIDMAKRNGVDVIYLGGRYRQRRKGGRNLPPADGDRESIIKNPDDLTAYLKTINGPGPIIEGKGSRNFVSKQMRYARSDIYFLSYLGEERFRGTLTVEERGTPEVWDPATGDRYGVPDFEIVETGLRFDIDFDPGQSKIFLIHMDSTEAQMGRRFLPEKKAGELFLPKRWEVMYGRENMLRIDKWRIIRSSVTPTFPSLQKLWRDDRYCLETKLKISAIRILIDVLEPFTALKERIRYTPFKSMDKDFRLVNFVAKALAIETKGIGLYQKFDLIKDAASYLGIPLAISMPPAGAEYEIVSYFYIHHIPDNIHLVWEDIGEPIEIYINGQLVSEDSEPVQLWDRCNRRTNLKSFLRRGKNRIGIKSRQPDFPTIPPTLHGIEPVVITGDFRVIKNEIYRWKNTTSTLSWGERGTGNYSGTVTYRCEFKLPARFHEKRGVLDLGDVRETARVLLNGKQVGVKLWPPYRFDITEYLKEEENILEISVSNTAENLLGTPIPSGIIGEPRLTFYKQKLR